MKIKHIRTWDGSGGTNCPALYEGEDGSYVVQGWKLDDETRAQLLNLADNETAVRVPAAVIAGIRAGA